MRVKYKIYTFGYTLTKFTVTSKEVEESRCLRANQEMSKKSAPRLHHKRGNIS